MIRRDWLRTWRELPALDEQIQSWDLTFGATGTSYVVGQVWGRAGANCYLLDQVREKLNFPDTVRAILATSSRWPLALTKVIEEAANGAAVIATLKDTVPGLVARHASKSKTDRVSAISGVIEAGNVYLPAPETHEWVSDLIDELCNFPAATNDDQVDALSMGLAYLSQRNQHPILFELPTAGYREAPWKGLTNG
jgi:predicted phage terminase large subunit-like protein